MKDQCVRFYPPRRQGLFFHLGVILVLGIVVVLLFLQATKAALGLLFLLYLLGALFLAVPIPLLAYRSFALIRSHYELERNGIRLQWGFRAEDIPMTKVLGVRIEEDLERPVTLPRLRWPGAVIGSIEDNSLGFVEFMAADIQGLVLITTPEKVFALSPEDPHEFLRVFQVQIELGSLSPLPAYSANPGFLLLDIWRLPTARIFLTISMVLSLALFVWIGLVVPEVPMISLGFSPDREPLPATPSGQLFLLPAVNVVLLLASYVLSMYFFRQSEKHPMMYVLWISSAFTALLFLLAVYFILNTG